MIDTAGYVPLLTEREAAALMRMPVSRLTRLRKARLISYLPGRPVLLEADDVEEFLYQRRVAAAPKAYGPPTLAQLAAQKQAECDAASAYARRTYKLRRVIADAKAKR